MEHVVSDETVQQICNFVNYGSTFEHALRNTDLRYRYEPGEYSFLMGIYYMEKTCPRRLAGEFKNYKEQIRLHVKKEDSYFELFCTAPEEKNCSLVCGPRNRLGKSRRRKRKSPDLICTLFTGQTSKEGIFMRYSYEFKLLCVDLYKSGIYPDTPNGTTDERFKKNVREWARMVDSNGPEVLKHKVFNKVWSPEEKLALVSQVIAGKSRTDVALKAGINPGMLYQWVQKYKTIGYNGLVENRKGRPPQISDMKKSTNPNPLTESEREELIRLRAENEYIKAENEVIKKRIALRQEKWAAQLKAKKQQLSKNLEKRDTN